MLAAEKGHKDIVLILVDDLSRCGFDIITKSLMEQIQL